MGKGRSIDEPIKVKGKGTINFEGSVTRHGPVISDFAADSGKDTILPLQWTALERSKELEAILKREGRIPGGELPIKKMAL
ncbi:penicillin acylase family protein [Pseudomonas sp. ISL-84]|nr:penicillin acylase family protein [Pseudomonas sp. ISL-84]